MDCFLFSFEILIDVVNGIRLSFLIFFFFLRERRGRRERERESMVEFRLLFHIGFHFVIR